MEPSQKSRRRWVIFGVIIAVLAFLIAVGPVLVTRHMRVKQSPVVSEFMIKVKGTLRLDADNVLYLQGNNRLFYVLEADKPVKDAMLKEINKEATVFGNIMEPELDVIAGQPVRMQIFVTNFGVPDLKE